MYLTSKKISVFSCVVKRNPSDLKGCFDAGPRKEEKAHFFNPLSLSLSLSRSAGRRHRRLHRRSRGCLRVLPRCFFPPASPGRYYASPSRQGHPTTWPQRWSTISPKTPPTCKARGGHPFFFNGQRGAMIQPDSFFLLLPTIVTRSLRQSRVL